MAISVFARGVAVMNKRFAVAAFMLITSAFQVGGAAEGLPKELKIAVTQLSMSLTDGHAVFYPENITIAEFTSSPWKKAKAGAVVLFYMGGWGGGNTNTQILTVFAKNEGKVGKRMPQSYRVVAFVEAGEKGRRFVELRGVKNGVITLANHEYADADPLCCPSRETTIQFTLDETGLKEIATK